MASSLVTFSNELAAIVEQTSASVVGIHARPRFNSSGVYWADGVVVTADHTIRHEENIGITLGSQKFEAELAGRDPGTDLAVLRVKDLRAPAISKADAYHPGSLVLAIGRNRDSVNAGIGIISSIGGASQTWRGGKLDQVVRLDLELHPAGSGGAIVDGSGKLIGIPTPVLSRVAVFAVPNATVDRVVNSILAHGKVPQGYLGAGLQPVAIPEHLTKSLGLSVSTGLMTISVDQDAPAGKAGLVIGDVVIEFAGQSVGHPESIRPLLTESIGKKIPVRILRGGVPVQLEIAVSERPGRR